MARNKNLRPIDDTRGPQGQFTSETGYRLRARRGGLARAHQQAQDGYAHLARARLKANIVNMLRAEKHQSHTDCAAFRESVLKILRQLYSPEVYETITEQDARLLR